MLWQILHVMNFWSVQILCWYYEQVLLIVSAIADNEQKFPCLRQVRYSTLIKNFCVFQHYFVIVYWVICNILWLLIMHNTHSCCGFNADLNFVANFACGDLLVSVDSRLILIMTAIPDNEKNFPCLRHVWYLHIYWVFVYFHHRLVLTS